MSGVNLPATLVFDYPTSAALGDYLLGEISAQIAQHGGEDELGAVTPNGVGAAIVKANGEEAGLSEWPARTMPGGGQVDAPGGSSTLGAMLREAWRQDALEEFIGVLMAVSKFRPAFGDTSSSDADSRLVKLGEGQARTELICLPSLMAASGAHQYVRFAKELSGGRDVAVLSVPGFTPGERLPVTLDAAVRALIGAIRKRASDAPFALVGYSSGGWLAHAMASRLEEQGESAAGLVLMDTYDVADLRFAGVLRTVLGEALENDIHGFMGDDRLTAMGAYMRLMGSWQPSELRTPTLLLRASEPMPAQAKEDSWGSSWDLYDDSLDVPGGHFTMMEEHAGSTAEAIHDWLAGSTAEALDVEEIL